MGPVGVEGGETAQGGAADEDARRSRGESELETEEGKEGPGEPVEDEVQLAGFAVEGKRRELAETLDAAVVHPDHHRGRSPATRQALDRQMDVPASGIGRLVAEDVLPVEQDQRP
jgi:hypothetical protein